MIRRTLTALWQVDRAGTLEDLPSGLITDTLRHFGQDTPGERPGGELVREVLLGEQQRFGDLLSRGREVLRRRRGTGPLTEEEFRYLHETHGLPREFVTAMLEQHVGPEA